MFRHVMKGGSHWGCSRESREERRDMIREERRGSDGEGLAATAGALSFTHYDMGCAEGGFEERISFIFLKGLLQLWCQKWQRIGKARRPVTEQLQ